MMMESWNGSPLCPGDLRLPPETRDGDVKCWEAYSKYTSAPQQSTVQSPAVQCSALAASTALYSSLLSVLQNNWTPTHHMEADMVTWPQEESESSDQSIN